MEDIIRLLSTIVILLLLSACDSSQQLANDISVYQSRMANVLDTPPITTISVTLRDFPRKSELTLATPNIELKLKDFFQLQNCELATLVAERNTVLGKLQLPSTRFIYETQLLQKLAQCIEQTSNPDLKLKLQNWYKVKQAALPSAWADLLQKSSEIKTALASNKGFLQSDGNDGINETVLALQYLLSAIDNKKVGSNKLETHLKNLAAFALPASLWRSQNLLSVNLSHTTQWLKQQSIDSLCTKQQYRINATKIEYLSNVFQRYFIEKIQPIASRLNSYHYRLQPIFEKIDKHPSLTPTFKQYISTQNQDNFQKYQEAMQEHVAYWQMLFKQCHIQPGKP